MGVPPNGWFIRENPIKVDDLGLTPIYGNPWKPAFLVRFVIFDVIAGVRVTLWLQVPTFWASSHRSPVPSSWCYCRKSNVARFLPMETSLCVLSVWMISGTCKGFFLPKKEPTSFHYHRAQYQRILCNMPRFTWSRLHFKFLCRSRSPLPSLCLSVSLYLSFYFFRSVSLIFFSQLFLFLSFLLSFLLTPPSLPPSLARSLSLSLSSFLLSLSLTLPSFSLSLPSFSRSLSLSFLSLSLALLYMIRWCHTNLCTWLCRLNITQP